MKIIPNTNNVYSITEDGRVLKNLTKEMSLTLDTRGYPKVGIIYVDKRRTKKVHRLVAELLIPNPNNLPQVNHIDGDKTNNHISNLEWCTVSHNVKHAYDNGLYDNKLKNHGKLTDEEVRSIRDKYSSGQYKQKELAVIYNCHKTTISQIVRRKSYSRVQ